MIIQTYNITDDKRKVDKTLGTATEMTGTLNSSLYSGKLDLYISSDSYPAVNYLYIPELNKYYFVDNIRADGRGYKLECSVDVLQTYREQIKQLQATVTYCKGNEYNSSNSFNYDLRPVFERLEFNGTGALQDTGSIVLITLKGQNK